MSAHDNPSSFRCADSISWAVRSDGLVMLRGQEVIGRLGYPEAALWDLFTRELPEARVVAMLRWIGGFPGEEETRRFVARTLNEWRRRGWVMEREPAG